MMGHYGLMGKRILLLWHLFSIALYTTFSLIVIIKDYGSVYTYILLGLLILYIVLYLTISILKYIGIKKGITRLQDGMSIITILKKILSISNLVMSILALLSSFDIRDMSSSFAIIVTIISIILASIQMLIAIFKIWIRHYMKKKAGDMQDIFMSFNTSMLTMNNNEDK